MIILQHFTVRDSDFTRKPFCKYLLLPGKEVIHVDSIGIMVTP